MPRRPIAMCLLLFFTFTQYESNNWLYSTRETAVSNTPASPVPQTANLELAVYHPPEQNDLYIVNLKEQKVEFSDESHSKDIRLTDLTIGNTANQKIKTDFSSIPTLRKHLPLSIPDVENLNIHKRQEVECLAWTLYFEARGGTSKEQVAVAYVPINRIGQQDFGDDICSNVFQYDWHNGRKRHQFSWVGYRFGSRWEREDDAWQKMQQIAVAVYKGRLSDPAKGAIYFSSTSVSEVWAIRHRKIKLGQTLFWIG